jgi:release factor glutamine methyltransferase
MADRTPWTPLKLVQWTTGYFSDHGIEHARSEAEILLAHALGARRIDLYVHYDQPLCESELADFKRLIKRRANKEPVAYITGMREFWSLELRVSPAVLIPRPETECLVEAVLPLLEGESTDPKYVLDLGTGSGAIVLALAKEHPEHRYVAMDRSFRALQIAKGNAAANGLCKRISWFCGDWLSAVTSDWTGFDLIVSNPPYIPTNDIDGLPSDIREFEPILALDGSENGLLCLRTILESAPQILSPGGVLCLEMGFDQAASVTSLAAAVGLYGPVKIVKDYSGHDRVAIVARRSRLTG